MLKTKKQKEKERITSEIRRVINDYYDYEGMLEKKDLIDIRNYLDELTGELNQTDLPGKDLIDDYVADIISKINQELLEKGV